MPLGRLFFRAAFAISANRPGVVRACHRLDLAFLNILPLDNLLPCSLFVNAVQPEYNQGCRFSWPYLFHQLPDPDGAVQKRVFGMQVEMNEGVAGHPPSI